VKRFDSVYKKNFDELNPALDFERLFWLFHTWIRTHTILKV
jgi:hypothetical protein